MAAQLPLIQDVYVCFDRTECYYFPYPTTIHAHHKSAQLASKLLRTLTVAVRVWMAAWTRATRSTAAAPCWRERSGSPPCGCARESAGVRRGPVCLLVASATVVCVLQQSSDKGGWDRVGPPPFGCAREYSDQILLLVLVKLN